MNNEEGMKIGTKWSWTCGEIEMRREEEGGKEVDVNRES